MPSREEIQGKGKELVVHLSVACVPLHPGVLEAWARIGG